MRAPPPNTERIVKVTPRDQGPTAGLDLGLVVAVGWGASMSHVCLSARDRPRAVWTVVKRAAQGHLAPSRRSTSTTSPTCRAFLASQPAALSPCSAGSPAPDPHPVCV